MSIQDDPKALKATARLAKGPPATQDAATYVLELVKGLRRMTGNRNDLRFMDYLLAAAEEEARQLAARQYH